MKKLFKRTTKGDVQIWWMEVEGDKYCTFSGKKDGKIVQSAWTSAKAKNVGKANSTTPEQQAVLDVEYRYTKQQKLGYFDDESKIDEFVYFSPMLAKKYEDYVGKLDPTKIKIWSSPKLDGYRCVMTAKGMFTRKGEPIVSCPHIIKAMADYFSENPDSVLDGELYNHDLRDDFPRLQKLISKKKPTEEDFFETEVGVQYYVYDYFNNSEPDLSFDDRYEEALDAVVSEDEMSTFVLLCESVLCTSFEQIDSFMAEYIENGYEGQMLRIGTGPYECKRTANLLKRKEFDEEEFVLENIMEGEGNDAGRASIAMCYDPVKDVRFSAGIRGNDGYTTQLLVDKDKYISGDVTIRFQGRSPYDIPRFPVAIRFFEGKRNL